MASLSKLLLLGSPLALFAFMAACGSDATPDNVFPDGTREGNPETGGPGGPNFNGDGGNGCKGLECMIPTCSNGGTTSLSGTVFAPNGTLPLYNVIVYVPNAELDPIVEGATCDKCGQVSGKPLVSTLSGVDGKFVLKGVPAGQNIPLVIQVGKWRRKVTIPRVDDCVANGIDDPELTRLPRSKAEGNLPKIAVTTGRCDQLACLLPKLGLDASEFSANTGTGKLNLYRGASDHSQPTPAPGADVLAPAPDGTPAAKDELYSVDAFKKYDMVMLSCECQPHDEDKSFAAKQALYDYTAAGGRVFASHFHYTWAQGSANLGATADWEGSTDSSHENLPGPYLVDTSFPKGDAFSKWLGVVGASASPGVMPISQPRQNVFAVNAPTQAWVYRNTGNASKPRSNQYLTINSPVGKPVDQQCGKFVFADMHLYGGDVQNYDGSALPDNSFPRSCSPNLTPEEKALAFLFFDLASCVQDDSKPPVNPK